MASNSATMPGLVPLYQNVRAIAVSANEVKGNGKSKRRKTNVTARAAATETTASPYPSAADILGRAIHLVRTGYDMLQTLSECVRRVHLEAPHGIRVGTGIRSNRAISTGTE